VRYSWPWDPVCVTIRNLDATHSLIFTYGLQSSTPMRTATSAQSQNTAMTSRTLDGLWWKQEKDINGFVALANTTSGKLSATLQLTDDKGASYSSRMVSVSPHGMKLVDLSPSDFPSGASGGIHITYDGPQSALIVNGGLEDLNTGYSAGLDFRSPPSSTATQTEMSFAELGLMVGAADPMMNFPARTKFTPYSILRNVSDAPASATPTLWWMAGGTAQSSQLPTITFNPGQSQVLDIPALISGAGLSNFNGSVNLVVDVKGEPGALLLAAGSVDQGNTYVFQVSPRGILESASKSLAYWSTGNGDDTMVTVWNAADEAQDLIFKLLYTGGHYSFPIHLGPRATQTLNISEIIQNQIPDSEGNTVPASIHEGSATLSGSNAENEHILVASDVGVYNVKKATCGEECYTCNGWVEAWLTPSPLFVETDASVQMSFMDEWNTGEEYNITDYASWSGGGAISLDPSIPGYVTGVWGAPGASVSVTDSDEPIYNEYCGPDGDDPCPLGFGVGDGESGTVGDSTPVITGITPGELDSGSTTQLILSGSGFGTNAPTLTFSPASGITYSLTSYDDTEIIAEVTVASGTPTETLYVKVTSTGYTQYGSGFYSGGEGQSATSSQASTTVQSSAVPSATVTVAFSGSKSAGDNLSFTAANPNECSQSLGLLTCTSAWHWNIEGQGIVSDDASKWTITQSVTGYVKGTVNEGGVLVPYSGTINIPNDVYNSTTFQNNSGQTTIYFIDGPGSLKTVAGYPVSSVTVTQNLTTTLCSTTAPSVCQTVSWYSTLSVAGGTASSTLSKSFYGTANFNF